MGKNFKHIKCNLSRTFNTWYRDTKDKVVTLHIDDSGIDSCWRKFFFPCFFGRFVFVFFVLFWFGFFLQYFTYYYLQFIHIAAPSELCGVLQ